MKKSTKISLILVVALLFTVGYYIRSEFYGDPLSKYLAMLRINSYINNNYPEKHLEIDSTNFEFKSKLYVVNVYSRSNEDISFQIGIKKGGRKIFFDQYIDKYAKDHELSERFANSLRTSITEALIEKIPQLSEVIVVIYIEKDKYPIDTEYSFEVNEPYSVILNFEGEQIFKHEFVELCYNAKETLKEKGFVVDAYIFDYREHNSKDKGGLGYSLELGKEQLAYSEQEMLLIENLSVYGDEEIQRKYNN
jgi:hypothetical protein